MTELLHIYAQPCWHEEAWIVGNRRGLEILRDAINQALAEGHGQTATTPNEFVCTNDGEGYDVMVLLEESEWGHSYLEPETLTNWDVLRKPYTDEMAQGTQHKTLGPWDLWRWWGKQEANP